MNRYDVLGTSYSENSNAFLDFLNSLARFIGGDPNQAASSSKPKLSEEDKKKEKENDRREREAKDAANEARTRTTIDKFGIDGFWMHGGSNDADVDAAGQLAYKLSKNLEPFDSKKTAAPSEARFTGHIQALKDLAEYYRKEHPVLSRIWGNPYDQQLLADEWTHAEQALSDSDRALLAAADSTLILSYAMSNPDYSVASRAPAAQTAPTRTLFHYTNEKGLAGILESEELNPSLWKAGTKDVRYGNGQYLTDIEPGTRSPASLARELIGVPNKYKFTHYIEIDVSDLTVIEGRPSVFVVPNETPLDLSGRIISSGSH